MEAQRKLVDHMENKVNELWLRLDYCTEKNRQGKKYDWEEGGRNLATVKTFGVLAKERPHEGTSEIIMDIRLPTTQMKWIIV